MSTSKVNFIEIRSIFIFHKINVGKALLCNLNAICGCFHKAELENTRSTSHMNEHQYIVIETVEEGNHLENSSSVPANKQ